MENLNIKLKPPYRLDRDVVAKFNLNPIVLGVLHNRGIQSVSEVQKYLRPTLSTLTNPFDMAGMDKAAELIVEAITNGRRICIFGDYDCDGVTSTALLSRFFGLIGYENYIAHIPKRFEEGYGLNINDLNHLIDVEKAELIITVDVGITSINEINHIKSKGCKVIVTDHHLPGDELPAADAIVNPQLNDCKAGKTYLCGAGVAFNLIIAVRSVLADQCAVEKRDINIKSLMDILALGTVADVVPLIHENRVYVSEGLKVFNDPMAGNKGLNKITELTTNGRDVESYHLGFVHGPRINATGRLDDAMMSYGLLMADEQGDIDRIAVDLEEYNTKRKATGEEITAECVEMVENTGLFMNDTIVLCKDDWNHGVIGISAGRVKDKYYKPTFVLAADDKDPDFVKGSGRSPEHFHLKNTLDSLSIEHPDLIHKYGGHAAAAGITLKRENLPYFIEYFEAFAKKRIKEEDKVPFIEVEAMLTPDQLTAGLADDVAMMEPFGQGNRKPIFGSELKVLGVDTLSGGKHLKVSFGDDGHQVDGIIWNVEEDIVKTFKSKVGLKVRTYFNIDSNTFRGVKKAQLLLKHTEFIE